MAVSASHRHAHQVYAQMCTSERVPSISFYAMLCQCFGMARPVEADNAPMFDHKDELEAVSERGQSHKVDEQRLPGAAEYCRYGVSVEGVEEFLRTHVAITPRCTTSDVCHRYVKPLTTPSGWQDVVQVVSAKDGWYSHTYVHEKTGHSQPVAPAGTCSFCERMSKDPSRARHVGTPTVFFSHAWMFRFVNVVAAMRAYTDSRPAGSPAVYFWFDCFSIDEHATQSFPPEWWDTTFLDAIRLIGHTVMYLSPWHNPVPLQRAWCLWELLCTISAGAEFEVCLGPDEKAAFGSALAKDLDSVLQYVGQIDAEEAEAGDPADKDRIFAAILRLLPRGFMDLNNQVKDRLRQWTYSAGSAALAEMAPDERVSSLLIDDLADYFSKLGQYELAEPLCIEAMTGRRRAFGDADPRTLISISSLGAVYSDQGKHDDAEPLLREALTTRRLVLGNADPLTLSSMNALAMLLFEMGEYVQAEPLYEEAIRTYRETGMALEPAALAALNNFGLLYCEWSKFEKAEPLMQEALQGRRQVLGDMHPETLITIIYNGWMYSQIPDYAKAQPLIEEAIPGCQKVLGDDHPKTLSAINLHGLMHLNMGNFVEAELPSQQALAARRRTLGDDHPLTLISMTNLGRVYHGMEELDRAQELLSEAVESSRLTIGIDHLRTLQRLVHLAAVYDSQGEMVQAERLYIESLAHLRKTVGVNHTTTMKTCHDLAVFFLIHGRYSEAQQLLRDALVAHTLASEHDDVRSLHSCLARVQEAQAMEAEMAANEEGESPDCPTSAP